MLLRNTGTISTKQVSGIETEQNGGGGCQVPYYSIDRSILQSKNDFIIWYLIM